MTGKRAMEILEVCLKAQIEYPTYPIFPPHILALIRRIK